jgi:hypothetical protein
MQKQRQEQKQKQRQRQKQRQKERQKERQDKWLIAACCEMGITADWVCLWIALRHDSGIAPVSALPGPALYNFQLLSPSAVFGNGGISGFV